MDCSLPHSSVHGISQARVLEWIAISFSRGSLRPSDRTRVFLIVQFSSVAQSCPTLRNPTNRSTPGLPVHHQLPEFIQTHITESVMPSNHLMLCHPLLLPSSIFPSIRVFSNESALCSRWPKYWSFSFNISLSNEHPGLISFRIDLFHLLQSNGLSRVFSNNIVQKHQFFSIQPSLWSNCHIHT